MGSLRAIGEIVSVDRNVVSGTPVFKGTRVSIQALLDHLGAGDRLDKFLADFGSVSRERTAKEALPST